MKEFTYCKPGILPAGESLARVSARQDMRLAMVVQADPGVPEKLCLAAEDFWGLEEQRVFTYSPEKLTSLLAEHLRYRLRQSGLEPRQLSLAMAWIQTKTGDARLLNLGSGGILSQLRGRLRCVLQPTGDPALEGIYPSLPRMESLRLGMGDGLLLANGGFLGALDRCLGRPTAEEALLSGELTALEKALQAQAQPDDCCFAAMIRTRM